MHRPRKAAGLAAIASAGFLAFGCGGDDRDTAPAENPNADLDRYCQLAEQLDRAGEQRFSNLEQQGASEAEVREAQREFLQQNADRLDEVVEVAPGEVQQDAQTFVAGLRSNLGLSAAEVRPMDVGAADDRLTQFQQENCPS